MKGLAEMPLQTAAGGARPRSRFFRLVVLLSAALTLSTFLPSYLTRRGTLLQVAHPLAALNDPASEWKDDVWPLRPSTPWDISTDFPYPRKLEYDVTEGTWLRLDVNPKSGDIIFDMLGDIYCLPASTYKSGVASESRTRARPVLLGVPHDSDPHFSPDGTKLVFRSDAELGVENIWVTDWKGCDQMDVRPQNPRGELQLALSVQEDEEDALARGVKETGLAKHGRLIREGRLNGQSIHIAMQAIFDACTQPGESPMRLTVGSPTHASIHLVGRSSQRSGTPRSAVSVLEKAGCTRSPTRSTRRSRPAAASA